MTALSGAQFNAKHSRGPGGLFAAQQAAAGQPSPAWASGPMRYDPTTRRGTGYGTGGGDARVRALQVALNALGLPGEKLETDGDLGPLTTTKIKAAQQRLGLKPDGVVTAQLMVAILTMKPPPRKTTARAKMSAGKPSRPGRPKPKPSTAPAATAAKPMYATGTSTRQKAI